MAVADPVDVGGCKICMDTVSLDPLKMIEVLSRNEIGNFADPDT